MKHLIHILFGGALLLGLIIILHHQKSESTGQTGEVPDLEHIELTAEIPALRLKESHIQPGSSFHILYSPVFAGKLRNPASQNPSFFQVTMKKQRDIFLEMRPVLDLRSGQYLYHPASFGDPPGFSS